MHYFNFFHIIGGVILYQEESKSTLNNIEQVQKFGIRKTLPLPGKLPPGKFPPTKFPCTPCPSAPVRWAPVASLVDNFAEIVSPANKWKNLLPWSYRGFIPGDFWETAAPHRIKVFSSGSCVFELVPQLDS